MSAKQDPTKLPRLEQFPLHHRDVVRYGDTDRQGHVNNVVFAQYLESGRVSLIYDQVHPLLLAGCSFVIARLVVDFLEELHWPGHIDIGTAVSAVGRSSLTLRQALFQNGRCAATAENVIVQISLETHRGHPLSPEAVARLQALVLR